MTSNGSGTPPTLFDDAVGAREGDARDGALGERVSERSEGALAINERSAGHARLQLRIRELNADRLARQDDDQRLGRRRAAVARLRRRIAESDEVEAGYWAQRRSDLQLVRS